MLKLRSEVKECLLLAVFAFLLSEFLTYATLGFVALGSFIVVMKIPQSKLVRNIIALGIFGSYWWTYGKVIDPEVGLNFLVSVIVLKLMEKETLRDRFMVFFGLLLIISAGSLFEKSLGYVIYFGIAFVVLIQDFYQNIGARWKIGELLKALIWVLPMTIFLFFLAPRSMSPLPFQQGLPSQGEVGYTPNINVSQVESLAGNNTAVFSVKLSKKLSQDQLYWRGNAISFTDGWNWVMMNKPYPEVLEGETLDLSEGIHQSFRMERREDYFFTLDHPLKIAAKNRVFLMDKTKSFAQGRSDWSQRYEATSLITESYPTTDEDLRFFQRAPILPNDREWIKTQFPATGVDESIAEVKSYFLKNGFSYSLAPGRIETFREFMTVKKTGFCSHYASSLALILRSKKMAARLVSGFMGGLYNPYADFYQISQNDAHVWVEVLRDGSWTRVDPTGWMAPNRLSLGGEAFMLSTAQNSGMSFLNQFGWYYDMRLWFSQWDFIFYQWLEDMDYQYQETWLRKFNLNRRLLYTFAILSLAAFMGLYAFSLSRESRKKKVPFEQLLWHLFLEKLHTRGLKLSPVSVVESRMALENLESHDREAFLSIWDELVGFSFKPEDQEVGTSLLKKIKQL